MYNIIRIKICNCMHLRGEHFLKKTIKVLLIVLASIVVLAAVIFVVGIFYVGRGNFAVGWGNFTSALKGLTTSTEQIEKNIEANKQEQAQALRDHGFKISDDDFEKIGSGEIVDEKEITDKLLGRDKTEESADSSDSSDDGENTDTDEISTESESAESDKTRDDGKTDKTDNDEKVVPETKKPESTDKKDDSSQKDSSSTDSNDDSSQKDSSSTDKKDNDKKTESDKKTQTEDASDSSEDADDATSEVDEQIAALVAKMYVYKSQYTGSISSIVSTMYYEFYALPKEQQVYSSKMAIYNNYAGQIASMEAQCDAQVFALVSELRALLKANGRDESLADSLLSAYNTEKENSKAYHISRYAD